ncbi:interferon-related developmental regulator 2-like isoform X1 [Seriola lalandi dorsalis]|uniref:interferon-related developmental regulator 2-like isoform X1 n=1 Tax=Seriola lalandi dorsalis TaxID=1841481 RepID=UPI000C6FC7A3|nr:interferon-related developmental regulator 2-like isoform X1 [Seriola lalandi dorsalis]XP_056241038.1 interferon-related developmental regulator 2 isoform X1 [Seriola aureovittata]
MPRSRKGKRGSGKPGSLRQEVLQLSAKVSLKGVRNGVKGESGASDDELTSDILSHCSSASETTSVLEEGTGGEQVDEQTAQEETEDKLKQCIDNLMDKSAKTRLAALESLRQAFSSKVLYDFLTERRLTVSDCLERSLKKGGGEEQAAAATVFALLCIQLEGGDEAEEGFKVLRPILTALLMDNSASIAARQSCARALGMCCYVSAAEEGEDLIKSLALLESIFMTSYPNREGALPTPKPGSPGLHSAALQAWSLLVTLCPASRLKVLLDLHLPKLQACLQSNDVNYRIAAGETIALLVELGRDIDEEFEVEDSEGLCECLKSLATDGNKHRAKNDRRKQRSIFREVLHYIENEDFTEEKIRFGVESVYIDSWMRRRIYDAFKEILESGVRHHLQFNPLLRDIFGLGPPIILDATVKGNKITRFEKHLFNSAAFKARTKQRNKVRDKRADVM